MAIIKYECRQLKERGRKKSLKRMEKRKENGAPNTFIGQAISKVIFNVLHIYMCIYTYK
jgi:hypothetical protein